jgi:hypothetical protein
MKHKYKHFNPLEHQVDVKKVFEYDIYECPEEFKGQLKIGDYF